MRRHNLKAGLKDYKKVLNETRPGNVEREEKPKVVYAPERVKK